MTHPLFGPEVRQMQQEGDIAGMKAFCETLHPATVAEALAEGFTPEEVWQFLRYTDIRTQAAVFEYFPIAWQVRMVEGIGRQHMARLIEAMSHDDRADLLRRLRPRVVEQLLRLVDEAERRDIAALTTHPENTAGALMTTDYAWLPTDVTVADALDRLRLQAPDRETIYYVYVLDGRRRLLGMVSLRKLILAPRHARVRDIMKKELVTARIDDELEKVAGQIARYDFLALPVVDEDGQLVGIVTADDVLDVARRAATQDMQKVGGTEALDAPYLAVGYLPMVWKRGGWLSALFLGEMLTATAMGHFEDEIARAVVLALFVPLIISSGGNSGSQAATLVVRALALAELRLGDWWRVFLRELRSGLTLGCWLGLIGFTRIWLWQHLGWANYGEHSLLVGLTVWLSLVGVVTFGSLAGSMLPFMLRRLGFDPATSSAPFVATLVDVTGLVIYFSAAALILTGSLL